MSPLKKHSQQPEWLLVSDHTSKEGKKTPFTQGFILKFPYVLCLARALGKQGKQQALLPQGHPSHKGNIFTLLQSHHLRPTQHFQGKGSCRYVFLPSACWNCPSGAGRARYRLKQLSVLLSLWISHGPAMGQLRREDTERRGCLTSHLLLLCQVQHI